MNQIRKMTIDNTKINTKHKDLNVTFWTSVNVNFQPISGLLPVSGNSSEDEPQDKHYAVNLQSKTLYKGAVVVSMNYILWPIKFSKRMILV